MRLKILAAATALVATSSPARAPTVAIHPMVMDGGANEAMPPLSIGSARSQPGETPTWLLLLIGLGTLGGLLRSGDRNRLPSGI